MPLQARGIAMTSASLQRSTTPLTQVHHPHRDSLLCFLAARTARCAYTKAPAGLHSRGWSPDARHCRGASNSSSSSNSLIHAPKQLAHKAGTAFGAALSRQDTVILPLTAGHKVAVT